jgi:hypothetical protein
VIVSFCNKLIYEAFFCLLLFFYYFNSGQFQLNGIKESTANKPLVAFATITAADGATTILM